MKQTVLAVLVCLLGLPVGLLAQARNELRFYLHSDPRTFDPLLVTDESSDTISFLTTGRLVCMNRETQALEPELATSWKTSRDGRTITFKLRDRVFYSDGSRFDAQDVAATIKRMMDPNTHSPFADIFGAGTLTAKVVSPLEVEIISSVPVAGFDRIFDQIAIVSSRSPLKEKASLGPYFIADYKPGSFIYLKRNPNYWKKDSAGRQLPYIDGIRLEIQANRDIEALHFLRGEIDLINSLDPEHYDQIAQSAPATVHDAGPSLDSEQIWFNQVANAPIPPYKRAWFRSTNFRRAIAFAINKQDLARVAFGSHAQPAVGPVSPANKFWFNRNLPPAKYDVNAAMKLLQQDRFRLEGGTLRDAGGNPVEFSIITNAGNKYRERMATMIQQDLSKIGIKVNVVTLDFPSLIERITETFNYEAALLGNINAGLDPNEVMNMWLSSGESHQWNPREKSPETPWEAEIDKLMKAQSISTNPAQRKKYFDRVQEIVVQQEPFIYLVNRDALSAISPSVIGAHPVVLRPETFWNIEHLRLSANARGK